MDATETTAYFIPGYSFSKEDPIQDALSIHLVLRCLFRQFGKRKDLNSLLAVRAVCSLWWEEALDIMHDFSKLIPTISVGPPERLWMRSGNFNEFTEIIKPTDALRIGGLPLNLIVSEWTPQVIRFLKERAENIASLRLRIPKFGGFSLEQDSFRLANLRFASFQYSNDQDVGANSYHCKRFQDALILFRDLIKDAGHLETCEISLDGVRTVAAAYQEELAHLPRNLTYLQTPLDCMENMARFQTWPSLHSLRLSFPHGNGIVSSQYINDAASSLTSLNLNLELQWEGTQRIFPDALPLFRLPVLPKLKELELQDLSIHEDLPELMPQLKNVKIRQSYGSPHDALSTLVTRDFCHRNVTDFTLREDNTLQNVDHVTRMTAFTRRFPNLVTLSIFGADFNIVATAPIIYSSLKRLRNLTLKRVSDNYFEYDVIQVITGVSREEIPEDESSWPDSLVGSPNAITQLTDLREFNLRVVSNRSVTQRESKFLFKAALLKMIHLQLINIEPSAGFYRLEKEVREEWEAGGRVIRIMEFPDENWALEDDSDNEVSEDENEGNE